MLVIYDKADGYIYLMGSNFKKPENISYLEVEVPSGKYLEKISIDGKDAVPVLSNIPKSRDEIISESLVKQQADIDYLLLILG